MSLALLPLLLTLLAKPSLLTEGESSVWKKTGRFAEVIRLCADFPRAFPGKVRCEEFGRTPEGRPMLALVAGASGPKSGRPVVLVQGGIHAGEIDGKDAGFWLLREVLEGKALPGLLQKLTVVFVPVFNVDGHERFGLNHRVNQVGPEEVGFRVTAQNLNLNRDYGKVDAPEMAAMLGLLKRYDPILYIDLHVTDGAKFQHDVAVLIEPRLAGPAAMKAQGQETQDALTRELLDKGHLPVDFYPAFMDDEDPASGFAYLLPPLRLSHGYWPLRNRFGVLVETHSWKDNAARVKASRDVVEGLLRQAMAHAPAWQEAARAADAQDREGSESEMILGWKPGSTAKTIDFLGYAYSKEPSPISGGKWLRYDENRPEVWKVPLLLEPVPALKGPAPRRGYLIPPGHAAWLSAKLSLHGLRWEKWEGGREAVADVQAFRVSSKEFKKDSSEGRIPVSLSGEWKPERRTLPAGTLFVPANQPGRRLLFQLLEPLCADSYAAWGFFNAHFEQKEYMEPYVAEEEARRMLAADPALKAAFEKRLASDKDFAKSPKARLDFFYRRHPGWDERTDLYPIFRLD